MFFTNSYSQYKYIPTDDQIDTMSKLAASNYFIDINRKVGEVYTSPEKREDAQKIASVDEYLRLGGEANSELRVSLRDFEPQTSTTKNMKFVDFNLLEKIFFNQSIKDVVPVDYVSKVKASPGTLCVSLGFFVCLSYGSEVGSAISNTPFDPKVKYDESRLTECKNILLYLRDFASNKGFQQLLSELYKLPADERNNFVQENIINSTKLVARGIIVPKDIIIQRSAFADNRPTLFCITKYRPDGLSKLTITFDSAM